MKKFRKLALYEKVQTEPTPKDIKEHVTKDLESKMKSTLERSDMTPSQKMEEYNNDLARFVRYNNVQKQPQFYPTVTTPIVAPDHLEEQLTMILPKTMKSKGIFMLKRLRNTPNIEINEQGELIYHGSVVRGSNVIDLIGDAVRKRKTLPPAGWQVFSEILKRANVPKDFIGNQERYMKEPIKKLDFSDVSDEDPTPRHVIKRPTVASNLARWTPYKD